MGNEETELGTAEEMRRINEEQLRLVVEHIPAAIAVVDRQLHYIAVSRRFRTDYGFGNANLIGRHHDEVFPDLPAHWKATYERCLTGATEKAEDEAFPRDGQTDWIRWEITPWYTNGHDIGGIILFSEIITERTHLRDQLRQAQKMEAIGQLAGGVAHDFNNILTAILGYSELLTEQIGPDMPLGRDLREIMAAAQRAAALTRQLLAFSRKQVLAVAPRNLSQIVRGVEAMLRRLIGEQFTVQTALADDLFPVMADTTQLEQVLMNLVVNGRDAMPQGGVLTITTANAELDRGYTSTHPGAKVGCYAMVSVGDTGIGMTPEVQAKIFEPFFTTKARGHGTGLGLAAVYGTVKQLGGYIGVESEPGRGTTFQVYLPRTGKAAQAPTEPVAAVGSPVGRETILLVEDEHSVREFVRIVLQRFGYRVILAESGEAALSELSSLGAPIHVLLTDVILPGMNGCELAARVTRECPHVQVLFMSGYTGHVDTADGFPDHRMQLLEKPFTAQALLTRIRQLIGLIPLNAVAAAPSPMTTSNRRSE
jgi:two-component system cell cycle sensor histidine kinase/response regulator CckA